MLETGIHITPALATMWLPWVLLAMIVLVWVCCMLQPQYLRAVVSNSFASIGGNSADLVPSIGSQLFQWIFNSAVPAVAVYVFVTQSMTGSSELLGQLLVLSLLIDLARAFTALIVQYTFRFGKRSGVAYLKYFSLRSLLTYLLLVLVMLAAYTSATDLWLALLGVAAVGYLIFLGVQLTRLFCSSVLDVMSVIIYLVTIELLPSALLFEAGRQLCMQQLA